MAEASLKEVIEFFGIPMSQFAKEWKELSDAEKTQIKTGIGDGTLTY